MVGLGVTLFEAQRRGDDSVGIKKLVQLGQLEPDHFKEYGAKQIHDARFAAIQS